MSLSEDEDDFLSADEEGFDEDKQAVAQVSKNKPTQVEPISNVVTSKLESVIESAKAESIISQNDNNESTHFENLDKDSKKSEEHNSSVQDEGVEDDEEALAKRIRERNIRIARKFSQEIAKNVKASAPIPLKETKPIDSSKIIDTEYSITPDYDIKSCLPPAPPPTPALSSSFNTSDEIVNASPSDGTQYGWRVPSKISRPNQAEESPTDAKIEQTRLALDRLSASLSQADNKNLFEKVAEDIKKVSLQPNSGSPTQGTSSAGIPLISDLSSTLGGWNWGGASKLLASATQVTSQVGSVLDSVVNVSQYSQQPAESSVRTTQATAHSEQTSELRTEPPVTHDSASTSGSGANSNDSLMDFTLNTMESLGKRAFGVMTERNESGSLQIKGLGRPWEHLMNVKKPQHEDADSKPFVASSSIDSCKKND